MRYNYLDLTCVLTFKRMMTSSIAFSSRPKSIAVGDLDNNHRMDIVVVNSGTNTIGIFLSDGNGTFTNQKTYSTGLNSRPYSVVINHFNDDRHLDIVVANYGSHSIGILLGNGNGTFSLPTLFSLGPSQPLFIDSNDFDHDGYMDVVVANYGTNTIAVLLGDGHGFFKNHTTYFIGYDSVPYSLAIGDFNKDDRLDIAVGRILADSPQRAKDLVDKIETYYAKESFGRWRNNYVVVSDDVDKDWEGIIQQTTDNVGNLVTNNKPFVNVVKIHADAFKQETSAGGERYPDAVEEFSNAIDNGALVVNYFGHGGEDGLADERIFILNRVLDV